MIEYPPTGADIAKVVERLYAGTLDDVAWGQALLEVADMVGASAALLLAFNPSSGEILREESHRFDPSVLNDYRRYWTFEDRRREAFITIPVGCAATELTLAIPDWRRTAILNEFLLPADAPHFMPAWLHKSDTKAVTLSLQGTRKRGPFEPRDLDIFGRLLPHVARALEIRDRLDQAQIKADTLAGNLDTLRFGVAVLDSSGRLLEANTVARELLRDGSIGRKSDGTLRLREPAGSDLYRWILSGTPIANNSDGLLHVPRARALPLSILATPLRVRSVSWIAGDPRWLLLIFDPDRRAQASAELIARDLGISAAEADVAALLVAGYNLQETAQRLGVTHHTTRSQLKSIFRKTGIRSQSDLVRRVILGPAGYLLSAAKRVPSPPMTK